jgi:hypothetical protein
MPFKTNKITVCAHKITKHGNQQLDLNNRHKIGIQPNKELIKDGTVDQY